MCYKNNHIFIILLGILFAQQGFIQTFLMSIRQHKKLKPLIEFSISIFIKFYFKACWHWNFVQNTLAYFYFKLFICPSGVKMPKIFWSFTLWTLTKALLWIHCRTHNIYCGAYSLETLSHLHFTAFKNSILVQKMDISRTA